ncbi:MAG: hypothetical protein QXH91_06210 [Candidatus Bathyarchaeia archaeon]
MWRCEMCNEEFEDEMIAVEVRFGYVNSQESLTDERSIYGFLHRKCMGTTM